jgi:hypothetical protein
MPRVGPPRQRANGSNCAKVTFTIAEKNSEKTIGKLKNEQLAKVNDFFFVPDACKGMEGGFDCGLTCTTRWPGITFLRQ